MGKGSPCGEGVPAWGRGPRVAKAAAAPVSPLPCGPAGRAKKKKRAKNLRKGGKRSKAIRVCPARRRGLGLQVSPHLPRAAGGAPAGRLIGKPGQGGKGSGLPRALLSHSALQCFREAKAASAAGSTCLRREEERQGAEALGVSQSPGDPAAGRKEKCLLGRYEPGSPRTVGFCGETLADSAPVSSAMPPSRRRARPFPDRGDRGGPGAGGRLPAGTSPVPAPRARRRLPGGFLSEPCPPRHAARPPVLSPGGQRPRPPPALARRPPAPGWGLWELLAPPCLLPGIWLPLPRRRKK